MWAGNITYWDDPRIKFLNQGLNLPHEQIFLVFANDTSASISDVFSLTLAIFDNVFEGLAGPYANQSFSDKMSNITANKGRSYSVLPGIQQVLTVAVGSEYLIMEQSP